jgi:hypothetical protein
METENNETIFNKIIIYVKTHNVEYYLILFLIIAFIFITIYYFLYTYDHGVNTDTLNFINKL